MFDVEQSIADWRKQMLAAGIKTPVPLEELENHLREEIERQMKSGLNEQNAFEITVWTIGQANALKSEFEKIKNMKLQTYIWTKRERLSKWQAIHKQLLGDDAQYRKRHASFLIAITFLSCFLLPFYLPFFGIRLFGWSIDVSIILGVATIIVCLALRQFRFQNQRVRRYLQSSHDA
ncbi:MAG TPA: hypothetical protein VK810_02560 [Dongiaceae bacterium]|jgi:hypothetical protein|nr:hypothetical protein [Dongiaceae bacterium]